MLALCKTLQAIFSFCVFHSNTKRKGDGNEDPNFIDEKNRDPNMKEICLKSTGKGRGRHLS